MGIWLVSGLPVYHRCYFFITFINPLHHILRLVLGYDQLIIASALPSHRRDLL